MPEQTEITVFKLDHHGQEVWQYSGILVERTVNRVTIEAYFKRSDVDLGYVVFTQGDRLIEHFYSDRWYNVFELHAAADDRLKGWYCNFARPARLGEATIHQEDLALDLWVDPSGESRVLDRDEFDALNLPGEQREQVLAALASLVESARAGFPPFTRAS